MNVRLEQFEGPLDLLVQLIHENKLNISEISLANITEQYLAYLVEVEERFPEELADFLVIATRLLLIKSKLFLPVSDEEEDDEERLSSQLKIYKTFVDASQAVQSLISRRRFLYARPMTRWSDMLRVPSSRKFRRWGIAGHVFDCFRSPSARDLPSARSN